MKIVASIVVCILLFFAANKAKGRALADRAAWGSADEAMFVPPPHLAQIYSAGYNELAADTLYIRSLIYGNLFDKQNTERGYRHLASYLDATLAADPYFQYAYQYAAQTVTHRNGAANQEEYKRSLDYSLRGHAALPMVWRFPYAAGLRYYLDLRDSDKTIQAEYKEKGVGLIEHAINLPEAPVSSLVKELSSFTKQIGKRDRAMRQLRQAIAQETNEQKRQVLLRHYRGLAGEEFPTEEARTLDKLVDSWRQQLPFDTIHMHLLLGPPPPSTITLRTDVNAASILGFQR